jgi:hypothetical protein
MQYRLVSPKGLSPTLFNIYINDMEDFIPNELPITTCEYADDYSQYELVSRAFF